MKTKFIEAYMDVAKRFAKLSYARRLNVGAVIVKNDNIISFSWNGTPAGYDNECEDRIYMPENEFTNIFDWPHVDIDKNGTEQRYKLKTKQEVIHAEMNALLKLAKSTESGQGATMIVTHSPCLSCAKSIYQAGIVKVYYETEYSKPEGVDFLRKCGVEVIKT